MDIRRDNKTGIGRDNNGVGDLTEYNIGAAELVARACIEEQRLLHCAFLLAAHSNTFLAFLSLKSVIG